MISGLEEARLIHLGVLQAVPVFDQRLILVDIGGGSTEVLVGERGETLAARSFKLGAVRLTDRFFPGGTISTESVRDCRSYVRSILATFEREVEDLGFDVAIASSGTAETIARMVHAARDDTAAAHLQPLRVHDQRAAVGHRGVAEEEDVRRSAHRTPGLDPGARRHHRCRRARARKRRRHLRRSRRFVFSEAALREGVLLDTIARLQGGALHHLRDVSRRSIRALAERCDDDLTHSAHVAALALQLFDATETLHGLPTEAREYLEAGALLANVGLVISHSKHHLHSYYVIRNSELTGLTDTEIEIIAQIARYHRKSAPKASHAEFGAAVTGGPATGQDARRHPACRHRPRPQPRRTGSLGDGAVAPRPSGGRGGRPSAARRSASSCTPPTSAAICSKRCSVSASASSPLRCRPLEPASRTSRPAVPVDVVTPWHRRGVVVVVADGVVVVDFTVVGGAGTVVGAIVVVVVDVSSSSRRDSA